MIKATFICPTTAKLVVLFGSFTVWLKLNVVVKVRETYKSVR